MADYEKPLPTPDSDSEAYWAAAKAGKLLLPKCGDCGKYHHYPRALCPSCHSDRIEQVEASGLGRIYSYTVQRRPAGKEFADDVPYVLVLVDLEEGPRMLAGLLDVEPEAVAIGQEVEVTFAAAGEEFALPFFKVVP